MGKNVVVTLTEAEWQQIKAAVLDQDAAEALRLLKEMVKQVEQQEARGLKSHLGSRSWTGKEMQRHIPSRRFWG